MHTQYAEETEREIRDSTEDMETSLPYFIELQVFIWFSLP